MGSGCRWWTRSVGAISARSLRSTSGTPGSRRSSRRERVKTYVARRLLALIPVGLVVATVAFMLMHLAPGNPASIIAGDDASPDDVRAIERQLGLDRPLPIQLAQWYGRLLR